MRVFARDFFAGTIDAHDPPICIHAADKLGHIIGRGLHKLEEAAKQSEWLLEQIPITIEKAMQPVLKPDEEHLYH